MLAIETYEALKFFHVLFAIVAVGFNASYGIWLARAARERDHEAFALRGVKLLDDRFANPAYGLLVIPLVFLARLNAIGSLVLVIVFSVIQIGGESAAREAEITSDVLFVLVGLMLLFMALTEYWRARRGRRMRFVPPELAERLRPAAGDGGGVGGEPRPAIGAREMGSRSAIC